MMYRWAASNVLITYWGLILLFAPIEIVHDRPSEPAASLSRPPDDAAGAEAIFDEAGEVDYLVEGDVYRRDAVAAQDAQWIRRPSKELFERTPGLIHETFESASMKTTVGYSVVLPPSYDRGEKRYPVVYWLHGGGGNECSSLFTSESWRDLYRTEQVREVILVYPNGFRSGYMDHHDGKIMVESMIIGELIPRIDDRYRTMASRAGRAVHGFSMGASGSLKFAIKYPELFCAAVAYGGGAIDLESSTSPFILNILKRNLNSDPDLIRQNNTYRLLEKNHTQVRRGRIRFLLICGEGDTWKNSAVSFQAALQEKKILCQLTLVPKTGHDLESLCRAEGTAAAVFQDQVFQKTSPE